MYLTTYIRSVLALSVATFLLTGCQENLNLANESVEIDSSIASETGMLSFSQFDSDPEATLVAKFEGQVKDSVTGEGIANVQVSVGDAVTTTDEFGRYALSDVNTTTRTVVSFEHQGYFHNSAVIQADQYLENSDILSSNYLEYELATYQELVAFDSQKSTFIDLANSAGINLPSSVYVDASGRVYNDEISPNAAYLDLTTDQGKETFPGLFEGKNSYGDIVMFVSYGLITVSLQDTNGSELSLTEDALATLTFPSVPSLEEQNIIPLWYYDYNQGLWIEEGYAELQSDGTYKGDVSHLGTWSLNLPVETEHGTFKGSIVYEDGTPASNVRLYAIGENWVRADLSTDADGLFEVDVVPDSTFKLKAYDISEKYEAMYDGVIPAVASGETVDIY